MSRGGRGGGRGGGKRGPDLSWDDEESIATPPLSKKPEELFPNIVLPVPRPISSQELSGVKHYLRFRDRVRNGPYYSILDPSNVADEKTGKVLKRAGFDPFNDQEKYTAKYHKKRRAVPDLSGRDYGLKHFPHELWPLLDPRRKNPLWKSSDIDIDTETNTPRAGSRKRKRELIIDEHEDDDEAKANDDGNDTDGSDPLLTGARRSRNRTKTAKRRRGDPATKKSREKRGLDAEDEISDDANEDDVRHPTRAKKYKTKGSDDEDEDDEDHVDEGNDNANQDGSGDEDDDDGSGDDEPVDSEFEESDDGGGDDYNAENYFDTGEGDDDEYGGGGGGGDDDGGYF